MNESTIKIPVFELFVDNFTETWEGWMLRRWDYVRRLLSESFKNYAPDKFREMLFHAPTAGSFIQRSIQWQEILTKVCSQKEKNECMIALLKLYRDAKRRMANG